MAIFGHFCLFWPHLTTFGYIWPLLAGTCSLECGLGVLEVGACVCGAPALRSTLGPTNVHSPTTHPLSNPPAVTTQVPETRYLAKVSTPLLLFFTELVQLQTGETSDNSGTPPLKWKRYTSIPFPHRSLRNSETETASQVLRVIAGCNGLPFMLDPDHQRDHQTRQ